MPRLLPLVGFVLAATITACCWCLGVWSGLFLAADLWMPEHVGVFMEGDRVLGAGILRDPVGTEVFAGSLRFAPLIGLAASGLIGVPAWTAARVLWSRLFDRAATWRPPASPGRSWEPT